MQCRICITLVSMLMLYACAATAPDYDEKLAQEDAAASTDIKQLFFEKLDYGEERREFFTLNLMHEFAEGKSVYRAFELPVFEQPYTVTLRSRFFHSGGKRQVFLPVVDKLDSDYQSTEKYEVSSRDAILAMNKGRPIEISLAIGGKDRYLVIHSPASVFNQPVDPDTAQTPVFARAGNLDIVLPLRGESAKK